ncbi:MAG: NAD(P)H-dependent oxidoreductase [Methanobacterium sp.]|nr:NAD(P)H-dependent oxidoreductase [Methanobacterium sp.]
MKILTIIGSPRKKGNSYLAVKELEEEFKNHNDYEFEYLFLKDAHLEICRGCFNCVSKGIDLCPLKDDRKTIHEKMEKSDGLVLVSPVYVMNVSALMKNFIDRVAYLCHRPAYHGKKALILCTSGGSGIKETLNYMEMIAGAWGYKVTSKCGLVTAPWPPTSSMEKKNTLNLEKSALRFHESLRSMKNNNDKKVSFKEYMGFLIFKNVSENVKKYMPADYDFYKNKDYYYPAKIGIITKIGARIILKILFFIMRDLGPRNDN